MQGSITQYRRRISVYSAITGLACLVLVVACGEAEVPAEVQLRRWVSLGQAAAEDKERSEIIDMISPAYADARGNERDDIESLLRLYFFRQHSIKLITSIDEIRLYGDSAAKIDLQVGMAGINDGVFGFSADAYRFQLELERDDEDWLLISARWGELGQELH